MRGLMTPFAHIKVIGISTERGHHTRHGLHLTNKAKDWIADILVQEIRKAHHLTKANPPTARHWKDVEEDTTQQTNPGTPTKIYVNTEPSIPGEMRSNGRRMEAIGEQEDEVGLQSAQTPQQAQPVPPLQHLLRSDVNGDLGQLGQMTRAVKSH